MRARQTIGRAGWVGVFAGAVLGAACSFDTSGIGVPLADGGRRRPTDAPPLAADRSLSDQPAQPDGEPDSLPPDRGAADAPAPKVITEAALAGALGAAKVPCVLPNGTTTGKPPIPIVDADASGVVQVWFYDGATLLAGAPESTQNWVSQRYTHSALVVFNPNACDAEDPIEGDGDWTAAGLLIRGGQVDSPSCPGCGITLDPRVTIADIDFVDANPDGTYDGAMEFEDFALPTDDELPSHPQLVEPINAAKQIILSLGL